MENTGPAPPLGNQRRRGYGVVAYIALGAKKQIWQEVPQLYQLAQTPEPEYMNDNSKLK